MRESFLGCNIKGRGIFLNSFNVEKKIENDQKSLRTTEDCGGPWSSTSGKGHGTFKKKHSCHVYKTQLFRNCLLRHCPAFSDVSIWTIGIALDFVYRVRSGRGWSRLSTTFSPLLVEVISPPAFFPIFPYLHTFFYKIVYSLLPPAFLFPICPVSIRFTRHSFLILYGILFFFNISFENIALSWIYTTY